MENSSETANQKNAGNYAEINRIFNNLIFDNEDVSIDEFTDAEEQLYHQVYAHIEERDKLSDYIPSPPTQLIALMQELEKEETNFDRVHEIVKEDLGLLGEIIRVSNSPLYRPRSGEIASLDKAISMLGLEGVMKVASVVMMRNVINIDSSRYKLYAKKQWKYCLKCAEACQLLSQPSDAFTNYLLGLLHNIGSVAIFSCFIELFDSKNQSGVDDLKVIQRIMMERAAWLSTLVAGEWGLPDRYLETLHEFEKLVYGQLDADTYALRSDATRILETGSVATQIDTLVRHGLLDRETGIAGLLEFELNEDLVEKIFSRFDLAEATLS